MELNKTKCSDCGYLHEWYGYKWVDSEERAEHNRVNSTTCPKCKSNNVEDIEDDEVMAPYRFLAETLFGAIKEDKDGPE